MPYKFYGRSQLHYLLNKINSGVVFNLKSTRRITQQ